MRDFLLSFLIGVALLAPEPLATPLSADATGSYRTDTILLERSHSPILITIKETTMIRLIYREPTGRFHIVEARRLVLVTVQRDENVQLELRLDETVVLPLAQVHQVEPGVLQAVYDYLVRQIEADYLSDRVINLNRILNGIDWRGTLRQI